MAKQTTRRPWVEWIILAVYLLMVFVGVACHEAWQDEWEAFLISREAHSLPQLIAMSANKGHPWLWYGLLKPFTLLPDARLGLALPGAISGVVAALALFLGTRMPLWIRTGLLFSFYWLYEYVVVSRSYGLAYAFTTLGVLAALRWRRWLLAAVLLGLAAHTHLLLALANLPLLLLLALWGRGQAPRRRVLALLLALLLSLTGLIAALGPSVGRYGQRRLASITGRAARVLPGGSGAHAPLRRPHRPAAQAAPPLPRRTTASRRDLLPIAAWPAMFLVLAGLWPRFRQVVLVYSLPSLAILGFFMRFVYSGRVWHQGTLFMVVSLSLVLCLHGPIPAGGTWLDQPWLRAIRLPGLRTRLAVIALSLALLVSDLEGFKAWSRDLRDPFSGGLAAAAYLREQAITPDRLIPRFSDMEEIIVIALAPDRPVPQGRLRPLTEKKWYLRPTRACARAADLARRQGLPAVIVDNPRSSDELTACPGLATERLEFKGIRDSVSLLVVQPPVTD